MSGFGEHYLPKKEVEQTSEEISAAATTENTDKSAEELAAAKTEGAAQTNTTTTDTTTLEAVVENTNTTPPSVETVTSNEVTFDAVKDFLVKNGLTKEFNSVEDLMKQPEAVEKIVEKEVNPWESILDDEDKAYLDYKKETGRTRKDFDFLKKDINSFDLIDLSIQRIKKDTGLDLSKDKAIEYLENKFNIDLTSSDELDVSAQIELNGFVKPMKEEILQLQEKYGKASENRQTQNNNNGIPDDVVVLENGTMMKKDAYQSLLDNHAKHIEAAKTSVNGVTESQVKVLFDDNGSKSELSYGYEYSNDDKQSMVSNVSDIDSFIAQKFSGESGLDYKKLAEGLWWSIPENREKANASMIHKAIAENTEKILKSEGNINFEQRSLHTAKGQDGIRIVPLGGPQEEVGMLKYFQPKP